MTAALAERDPATLSPMEQAMLLVEPDRRHLAYQAFSDLIPAELNEAGGTAWHEWLARPSQRMPSGAWSTWIIRAGRGFGKTRAGAEAVRRLVNAGAARSVTIIGKTPAEARDVMIGGPSGLLAVHPARVRPTYEPSKRLITWPNGALGHVRSAADPDSVRGLNSDLVWGDEPSSWVSGSETWDNAMLGNRVGTPHAILTGTPRPLPWLRALEEKPRTAVTTGTTYENVLNLADEFVELVLDRYEGTRLGAQELHAQYLDDVEGALWTLAVISAARFTRFNSADPWKSLAVAWGPLAESFGRASETFTGERRRWRTVVGVDPSGSTKTEAGIVVAAAPANGRAGRDHCVILDDRSLAGTPEQWGAQVVAAYHAWNADACVVEHDYGGNMATAIIHGVDPTVTVENAYARAGGNKGERAEPISALYGRGWVHHLGHLAKLEDELTSWVEGESPSPNRLDAMVHAVTVLLKPSRIGRASLPDQHGLARQRL